MNDLQASQRRWEAEHFCIGRHRLFETILQFRISRRYGLDSTSVAKCGPSFEAGQQDLLTAARKSI
jgi:hypothetical protein